MPLERGKDMVRRRKAKKSIDAKDCPRTHLVYYTQTPCSPFSKNLTGLLNKESQNKPDNIKKYFSNVINKQYNSTYQTDEFSDTSHINKPVCRDFPLKRKINNSAVWSCCHGKFQNIDDYMPKSLMFEPIPTNTFRDRIENNCFYNTDLYDMVPVKEYAKKTEHNKKIKADTNTFKNIDERWPTHNKNEINPVIVNYYRTDQAACLTKDKHSKIKRHPQLLNRNKSRSDSVNCGQVYVRQNSLKRESETPHSNKMELSPMTNKSKSVQLDGDLINNQTTEMLNQIKNILQTVLREVKTNTEIRRSLENKVRKDAVVQKGSSQNNVQGTSTLMNSFSYNEATSKHGYPHFAPYPQIPSGHIYYTGLPHQHMKYVQNLPFVVSSFPGRHVCACSVRKSTERRANSIATNTEGDLTSKKINETDDLIKEIYKSVALNIDYPDKNSTSECQAFRSDGSAGSHLQDIQIVRSADTNKTDKEIDASLTPRRTNAIVQTRYTESSSQSEDQIPTRLTKDSRKIQAYNMQIPNNRELYRLEENKGFKGASDDTDLSYSDDSYEAEITPTRNVKKPAKEGFFKRLFNLNKKQKNESKGDADSANDTESEDYETVYTDSVRGDTRLDGRRQRRINIRLNGKKLGTSNLEQEERRAWREAHTLRSPRPRVQCAERWKRFIYEN
ncbi:uncharacterized protein LOC126965603 isoform X2 [Leptidea sinapis]|uniref:uncharacterized protein LOC126965603 isoform X2 n=1 Tax=Leptidea sinapis TaxID=189913 RepID=UPI0021C26910|nr:uncharacterized protein LOC126965603 isoform X2 [Leptidea sinapis]